MSVIWQKNMLAVAYYDLDDCQIYVMPDTVETQEFKLLSNGETTEISFSTIL